MIEDNEEFLLKNSKVFCMMPWITIHSNPMGKIYPCSVSRGIPVAVTANSTLEEAYNSLSSKQLRMDMLNEKYNPLCFTCHKHEDKYNNGSFRSQANELYGKYFKSIVPYTDMTGNVSDFKLRCLDVRFNNNCNFKCRTCSSDYSIELEKENEIHLGLKLKRPNTITNKVTVLEEITYQIENLDEIYFSGGEPLITDEHYQFLEEIIRQGRTDILLNYNTNCSTLMYKDKDLLKLWSYFKNINVACSFDHFGQRAQYIRRGTIWPEVQENFLKIKKLENVKTNIITVLSIFNYLTLPEFFTHLIVFELLKPGDPIHVINKTNEPKFLTSQVLPQELKKVGRQKITEFIPKMSSDPWSFSENQALELSDCITFTELSDNWEENKNKFQLEIKRLDKIRQENFVETFPELESLVDDTSIKQNISVV